MHPNANKSVGNDQSNLARLLTNVPPEGKGLFNELHKFTSTSRKYRRYYSSLRAARAYPARLFNGQLWLRA